MSATLKICDPLEKGTYTLTVMRDISDKIDVSIRSTYNTEETHGPIRNAVIQGLHYWINHPRLFTGQYARVTLAR
jgi:hypothetical protein